MHKVGVENGKGPLTPFGDSLFLESQAEALLMSGSIY